MMENERKPMENEIKTYPNRKTKKNTHKKRKNPNPFNNWTTGCCRWKKTRGAKAPASSIRESLSRLVLPLIEHHLGVCVCALLCEGLVAIVAKLSATISNHE